MENTTKALIIAAAVLVVIILVSLGILLIQNVGETEKQAEEVSNLIGQATGNASNSAIGGIKGTIISADKFNEFTDNFNDRYVNVGINEVWAQVDKRNLILKNQIQMIGYVYKYDSAALNSEHTEEFIDLLYKYKDAKQIDNIELFDYKINTWIPNLLKDGKIAKLDNPQNIGEIIQKAKGLNQNRFSDWTKAHVTGATWAFTYDMYGYINKAYYIAVVDI